MTIETLSVSIAKPSSYVTRALEWSTLVIYIYIKITKICPFWGILRFHNSLKTKGIHSACTSLYEGK